MILIQPSINPIIISLGFIDIRWYSIAYILSFVFGSILIKQFNRISYNLLSNVQIDRFFIWAVIGVIIGGRIGYVLFYQTNLLFLNPEVINPEITEEGPGILSILILSLITCETNS